MPLISFPEGCSSLSKSSGLRVSTLMRLRRAGLIDRDNPQLARIALTVGVGQPGLIEGRQHLRDCDQCIGSVLLQHATPELRKHVDEDRAIEIHIKRLTL